MSQHEMIQLKIEKLLPHQMRTRIIFAAGLLLMLSASIWINPEKTNIITCWFREITGHSCPSCGLSRSIYAVAHLHIKEAFRFHLMGPVLFGILLLLLLKFAVEIVTKKGVHFEIKPILVKFFLILFFGLWLVYWIVRFLSEF